MQDNQVPSISICIVVFHTESSLLEQCLSSISISSRTAGIPVDVVVVDNSSNSNLQRQFSARVRTWTMAGRNLGFGAAANMAVAEARGEYVLLLNPDAALADDALAAFISASRDPEALYCGWLQSRGTLQVDAYMHWWSSTGRLLRRGRYRRRLISLAGNPTIVVQKVSGGALWARRSVLLDLGPFDERYFLYGEDADLSLRARHEGRNLLAVPGAKLGHVGASSQVTYSRLVESARADAAIRVGSYHLRRAVALALRFELMVATIAGLTPGLGKSSSNARARYGRLAELKRWGLARDRAAFEPAEAE